MFSLIGILLKSALPIAATSFALVWWALRKDYLGGATSLNEYERWKKADDKARKAEKKSNKSLRKAERRNRRSSTGGSTISATDAAVNDVPPGSKTNEGSPGVLARRHKPKHDFLHSKWMAFGGGFYGVVAVFTYALIEVGEVRDFFAGLAHLFDRGLISLVIGFVINSIMNFVAAIAWPMYWLQRIHSGQWLWAIGAYAGYWLGARAAFLAHFNKLEGR